MNDEHLQAARSGMLIGGPQRFRKRPVEILALQFTGDNIEALWDWATAGVIYGPTEDDPKAYVITLEGRQALPVGNWLIRGVAGEFYSCDPDIFDATYDAV